MASKIPPPPNDKNKIIVYERRDFKGLSREFIDNVPDLTKMGFNDCISSLKVIGSPWVTYTDPQYQGTEYVYEEGEYARLDWENRISSLERIWMDLCNPNIVLYEHPNHEGRSIELTCETNLCYADFNDTASSCKVKNGVWVLYQHTNRRGYQYVAHKFREDKDLGWFNYRISHVRPLNPGKAFIESEVLWEEKEEIIKDIVIDSMCGLNYGSREQTFSSEMSREYESSITESFTFNNSTMITCGIKFEVNIGAVKAIPDLSVSNKFTVEKGERNTKTERKRTKINLPATTPPHTKLTVNVVRKEVDVIVPVKLTITQGYNTMVEYGQYRFQDGNSIIAEYTEEAI